ncbi:hypothetical protein [uncultured Aquimarina sp.]|uniref:hypothetical protein n=1 Tax=uncultured Aquimarina sp. TaxID=575652 RepID=UPI00262D4712|nr:hypothetical protein [uncultured Aquimarina sp.]
MKNSHKLVLNSNEEFENHLRNCVHWNSTDVGQYDVIGITGLLSALLDNLNTRCHQSEYENLREILSNQNLEFLRKLLNEN